MARRLMVIGGFMATAWLVGSAPAGADALATLDRATEAVTTTAAEHSTAGTELLSVAHTAENIVSGARSAVTETVPATVVGEQHPEIVLPDLQGLHQSTTPVGAIVGITQPAGPARAVPPRTLPAEPAVENGTETEAEPTPRESAEAPVLNASPSPSPSVSPHQPAARSGPTAFTAGALTHAPAPAPVLPDEPVASAHQSVSAGSPQAQSGAFPGGFAGYLAHQPVAPKGDALASATRHALELVPQQPADEHFSSPD
ncbi:hypothetical protein [Nocardiopsis ansamitocini]|uniref:Uncharacterized protein n=1 Tax=Nocardiopsis ansamitocini TaxID=1670832 RepID=A0A9W6UHW9_9ACTN|nr:hypothetical protein [Nocardiopsis ansamitocini]GLU47132.1 hypothetical protein Nans01_14830 [Nocardiopsis ansamitocini]